MQQWRFRGFSLWQSSHVLWHLFKASKLVESNKKHCTAESLLKVHANICSLVVVHLASISCLLVNLVDLFLQKINLLNYQSLIWTVYKTSKTYKDESKSSTLMFNMTFLSDMEVDTKKKDESQPSRILASCRTSVGRVCSMEFLKERLIQHPTSSNLLYLLSLGLVHHHHWPSWKIGFPPLSGLPPTTWTCSLGTSLQESPPPSPSYHKE